MTVRTLPSVRDPPASPDGRGIGLGRRGNHIINTVTGNPTRIAEGRRYGEKAIVELSLGQNTGGCGMATAGSEFPAGEFIREGKGNFRDVMARYECGSSRRFAQTSGLVDGGRCHTAKLFFGWEHLKSVAEL